MQCVTCGCVNGQHTPGCPGYRDDVNHPPHYKGKGMESIEVIEAFDLGFNLGNAIKYILRAGRKGDGKVDLAKARWYIDREIKRSA